MMKNDENKDKMQKHNFLKKNIAGLAGVALGTAMIAGASNASADEVPNTTNTVPVQNQTDTNAVLPGTPSENTKQTNISTNDLSGENNVKKSADPNSALVTGPDDHVSSNASISTDQDKVDQVKMTYYVHDDDENDKVVFNGNKLVGEGEKIDFSKLELPANYVLADSGTVTAGSEDFKIDIHAKHEVITLAKSNPVLIQRTITVHNPDNSIKTIKQEGYYQTPSSVLDQVTKKSQTEGEPTLTGIDEYTAPTIDGYKPSIAVVPALTAKAYDEGAALLVDITYTKNNQKDNTESGSTGEKQPQKQEGKEVKNDKPTSEKGNDTIKSEQNNKANLPAIDGSSEKQDHIISNEKETQNSPVAENDSSQKGKPESTDQERTKPAAEGQLSMLNDESQTLNTTLLSAKDQEANKGGIDSQEAKEDTLPQTGNENTINELAALGLGTIGIVGSFSLAKRKEEK